MALLTVWVYVKVSSAGLLDFMVASSPVCCIPRMAQNNQESFMEQLWEGLEEIGLLKEGQKSIAVS